MVEDMHTSVRAMHAAKLQRRVTLGYDRSVLKDRLIRLVQARARGVLARQRSGDMNRARRRLALVRQQEVSLAKREAKMEKIRKEFDSIFTLHSQ